jgi:hypothetical protein
MPRTAVRPQALRTRWIPTPRRGSRSFGRKNAHRGSRRWRITASGSIRRQVPIASRKNRLSSTMTRRMPVLAQSQSGADPCAAGGCLDPITVTAQRPSVWSSVWNFVTGLFASPSTPYRINGIPVNEGVFFPPLGAATEGVAAGGARFIVNSAGDALDTEAPLYRVFGDQSPATGQFWSTVDPAAVADYRTAAGLFPGNSGQFVAEGVLTDSSGVTFGTAAPGPGGVGGGLPEVIVPNAGGQICFLCVSGANPPF